MTGSADQARLAASRSAALTPANSTNSAGARSDGVFPAQLRLDEQFDIEGETPLQHARHDVAHHLRPEGLETALGVDDLRNDADDALPEIDEKLAAQVAAALLEGHAGRQPARPDGRVRPTAQDGIHQQPALPQMGAQIRVGEGHHVVGIVRAGRVPQPQLHRPALHALGRVLQTGHHGLPGADGFGQPQNLHPGRQPRLLGDAFGDVPAALGAAVIDRHHAPIQVLFFRAQPVQLGGLAPQEVLAPGDLGRGQDALVLLEHGEDHRQVGRALQVPHQPARKGQLQAQVHQQGPGVPIPGQLLLHGAQGGGIRIGGQQLFGESARQLQVLPAGQIRRLGSTAGLGPRQRCEMVQHDRSFLGFGAPSAR
ncbi:hypothetical protein CSA17_04880 [bacterium DOLJORAL78_65_58]|nr:MAG: hypothetical protein CSA17_04880 [bacterium DOLJORAL78_65_58]